jgi:hypothetical protein
MPDELHNRIRKIAKERQTNVTALINEVMSDFIENNSISILDLEKRIEMLEKEVFKEK